MKFNFGCWTTWSGADGGCQACSRPEESQRRGKKEGRPEVEKGKPLMVEGKRHLVVEEWGPEEEEQGPE